VDGFSLHAKVRINAIDRKGLEHLCRYVARPAIANHRLKMDEEGMFKDALAPSNDENFKR